MKIIIRGNKIDSMLGTLYINSITEKEVMVKMAAIGKQGFFLERNTPYNTELFYCSSLQRPKNGWFTGRSQRKN